MQWSPSTLHGFLRIWNLPLLHFFKTNTNRMCICTGTHTFLANTPLLHGSLWLWAHLFCTCTGVKWCLRQLPSYLSEMSCIKGDFIGIWFNLVSMDMKSRENESVGQQQGAHSFSCSHMTTQAGICQQTQHSALCLLYRKVSIGTLFSSRGLVRMRLIGDYYTC